MSQNNPFSDAFKAFESFKAQIPAIDTNEIIAAGQRNLEVIASANQALAEGVQAIVKLQLEIAQSNAESALELIKEIASSKDPKEAAAKQANFAKSAFEKAATDANRLAELASKSNNKACEIVGKQVTETIKNISKPSSSSSKKREAA